MRSFQIELKLNQEQTTLCAKSAGTARYAYNWALGKCQEEYACAEAIAALAGIQKGEKIGYSRTKSAPRHKDWNIYKKSTPWIKEVSKCCGQEAFRDLDNAYDRFFKGLSGFPKFKKKGDKDSFRLTGSTYLKSNNIQLPNIGIVKLKEDLT